MTDLSVNLHVRDECLTVFYNCYKIQQIVTVYVIPGKQQVT